MSGDLYCPKNGIAKSGKYKGDKVYPKRPDELAKQRPNQVQTYWACAKNNKCPERGTGNYPVTDSGCNCWCTPYNGDIFTAESLNKVSNSIKSNIKNKIKNFQINHTI